MDQAARALGSIEAGMRADIVLSALEQAAALDPEAVPQAVRECLDVLAFGAASDVIPKFTPHSDPASQWTSALKGPAFFA